MNLKQLEYIVAISEYGNITKAADALFITQSGLNQQLNKLEKELDIQLFTRNNHFLRLTKAGEIYVSSAREILQIKKNAYTVLDDLKGNTIGEINLGLTHEHGIDLFTSVFPSFNKKYPGVTFNLLERIVSLQHKLLLEGHLDMGLVMLAEHDREQLEYIPLFKERLILGMSKDNPLAILAAPPGRPLASIDLKCLEKEKFSLIFSNSTMRNIIDPLFKDAGYQPQILIETAMNHALAKLVSIGLCCTIIPQSRALSSPDRDKIAWFYLTANPSWDVCIAYRKQAKLSQAERYFIKLAKEYGEQIDASFY